MTTLGRRSYRYGTSRLLALIAFAAATAIVAGGTFVVARTPVEPERASAAGENDVERMRTAKQAGSETCPTALRAGRLAPARITEAIRREVPRAYADMSAQGEPNAWRGYSVVGVFSLDPASAHGAPAAWGRALTRFGDAARNLCGETVARHSWVALVRFPRAANALVGEGVTFLARTRAGWRIWATAVASELPRLEVVRRPARTTVASRNCDLEPAPPGDRAIVVYLHKANYDRSRRFPGDPRVYVPLARRITAAEAEAPLRAALLRLLRGVTPRERRLGCYSTFSDDAGVLRAVKIVDGQAVVDFHRRPFRDDLAFVSTSHAGAVFMAQLSLTIFQFPNVKSIRYEFDGNCRAFGDFMQAAECVVVPRRGVGSGA